MLLDTTFFACWVHPCQIHELAINLLSVAENEVLSECLCRYVLLNSPLVSQENTRNIGWRIVLLTTLSYLIVIFCTWY